MTAPKTEPEQNPTELDPAVEWIRERGGTGPVARDIFKVSLSSNPNRVREAIGRAGAPPAVFGLIYRELYQVARWVELRKEGEAS